MNCPHRSPGAPKCNECRAPGLEEALHFLAGAVHEPWVAPYVTETIAKIDDNSAANPSNCPRCGAESVYEDRCSACLEPLPQRAAERVNATNCPHDKPEDLLMCDACTKAELELVHAQLKIPHAILCPQCRHAYLNASGVCVSCAWPTAPPSPADPDRHERLRSGLDVLKGAPDLGAIAECGERLAKLVHDLASCPHGGELGIRPDSVIWCTECGACKFENGRWARPELAVHAKAVDADRQRLGATFGAPSYDSDVQNVIPIKPRS